MKRRTDNRFVADSEQRFKKSAEYYVRVSQICDQVARKYQPELAQAHGVRRILLHAKMGWETRRDLGSNLYFLED